MNRRICILLGVAVSLSLVATGCGAKERNAASTPAATGTPAVSVAPSQSAAPATPSPVQEKEAAIKAYFGQANGDNTALVEKQVNIKFDKDENKYLAALNALKKSPSADAVSLCPKTTFLSAKLDSGKLSVNLNLPDEDRLGSAGEGLLLDAFRKTLFQFNEVETFEILVNGKKPESLMGHFELPEWFKR